MYWIAKLRGESTKQLLANRTASIPNDPQTGLDSAASEPGRDPGSVIEGGRLFAFGLERLPCTKHLQFPILALPLANVAWLILSRSLQSRCAIHQPGGPG